MSFNRLTWGVKASFRSYVEAAGGSTVLSDGATRAKDGAFVFAAEPDGDLAIASDGSASGTMRFLGTVTFEAHGGMLKTMLTELGIETGTDGLVLTARDTQLGRDRCVIAELGPAEVGPDGEITLGAQITLDGSYQIADNYPPGTELDPLRLD
jgi:hypothetical protein